MADRGSGGVSEGPLLWYLNRATGLTLLVLLTASVVLGVLSTGGCPARGVPVFVTQHLHRNVALLSVVALVVHVLTAVGDGFVDIRWWHALQPFGAEYEPLWLGLGSLSLDLILVVVVTSALRTRLGHRAWRSVHYASWAAWASALAHTLGIGTDVEQGELWAVVPTAACVLAVCLAAGLRLGRAQDPASYHPVRRTS
jgi:sulfoxide reductase heme-binding subunit YedZ